MVRIENVLNVYALPHDPAVPVVCADESCMHQLEEVRPTCQHGTGTSQGGTTSIYGMEWPRFSSPLDRTTGESA